MQYEDDIAFQRAILANPADTTLKLVYADWLQDRADPRAEYIRRRLEIRPWSEVDAPSVEDAYQELRALALRIDPKWVAFMNTFAEPFAPNGFTFGEQMGTRGTIWHFESQYREADTWSATLVADAAFLDTTFEPTYASDYGGIPGGGFLCDALPGTSPFTAKSVLAALKVSAEYLADGQPIPERCFIHQNYEAQRLTHYDEDEMSGVHGELKRYVANGELWYLRLTVEEMQDPVGDYSLDAVLTLGRSPHSNRLVGAIGFPIDRCRG
jgi:uncharacterized protein (TIGR02996 family)